MNDQSKICNNCRVRNDVSALKCKSCQAPMTGSMVLNFQVSSEDKSFIVCKNCNSINKSANLKCSTCNAPLLGSMVIDHNFKPVSEVIPAQTAQINLPSPEPVPSQAQHNKTEQFGMKVCKNCHYPNLPIAKFCVKCNVDLDLSHTPTQNTTKGDTPAKSYAETNMKATINPWLADKKERTDQFELIPLENNDLQLNAKKSYDGQSVELTRMNLDPENETITTSIQATIYKKENKWMVSNKSKLKTTFIRIDEDMEICNGMILMFGNKCYQFKSETE